MRARLALLAALTALVAGGAAPAAHASGSGCDIHNVFFDVVGMDLTERVTAHWTFAPELGDETAALDTVETGHLAWHHARSTRAERRKLRQVATFTELTGDCRVPNFRQGELRVKAAGMTYHVDGTWSAGEQSGPCAGDETTTRAASGNFPRKSTATKPPARTVGVKIVLNGPVAVDCPFTAFRSEDGTYVPAHLRGAHLGYLPYETTIAKRRILGRKSVTLRFALSGDGSSRNEPLTWRDGKVAASLSVHGEIRLRRYKDCHVRSLADILRHVCLGP